MSRPTTDCGPIGYRSGLQFLVSTGRHHGFESLAEARLLLALDFAVIWLVPGREPLMYIGGFGVHFRLSRPADNDVAEQRP